MEAERVENLGRRPAARSHRGAKVLRLENGVTPPAGRRARAGGARASGPVGFARGA